MPLYRELVPIFSWDIFLVETLLEVLGVYIDWRSAGAAAEYQVHTVLSSDVFTTELCNASTSMPASYIAKFHSALRRPLLGLVGAFSGS